MQSVVSSGYLLTHGVTPVKLRQQLAAGSLTRLFRGWFWTGPDAPPSEALAVALTTAYGDTAPVPPPPAKGRRLPMGPRPTTGQPPLVIGGRLAAELQGFELVERTLPTWAITRPGSAGVMVTGVQRVRTRLADDEVRYVAPKRLWEVGTVRGRQPRPWLAVTSPTRTVADCAPALDDLQLLWMVEQLLDRFRTEPAARTRVVHDRLLQLRPAADPKSRSPLETAVRLMLTAGGCPAPASNVTVLPGIVCDLVWPDRKVVVECDGFAYHSEKADWDLDATRTTTLRRAGWTVIRVTWKQLRETPRSVLAEVRAALGR